ncbi:zinc finger protein 597 isoform X2 [Microcebus murinus]|uniref:zinc finger protein 597 isoform X2 n=1 Tax=Microcebus murinus TaxID=30608 RepID=UPI003F6AE51C
MGAWEFCGGCGLRCCVTIGRRFLLRLPGQHEAVISPGLVSGPPSRLGWGEEQSAQVLKGSGQKRGRLGVREGPLQNWPHKGLFSPLAALSRSPCGDLKKAPPPPLPQMASALPTTEAQGPMLFEDLAVYFSQEECVSLHPIQRSLSRDATQECFEDVAFMGVEGETEMNQQLSLESMELEELSLEEYPIPASPVQYPESSSEDGVENPEEKISGGTPPCKKKFISLLVTIDNHTPLVELSECLGAKALSEILEFPWEEAENVYKCPDCDQNFSDKAYFALHRKMHLREKINKTNKCDDCGKVFNHRAYLRAHIRIHTGEKPYKCLRCCAKFRRSSCLSRHMKSHRREKLYVCNECAARRRKSHTAEKANEYANSDKCVDQETDLALDEETQIVTPEYPHTHCMKTFEQSSCPAVPEKAHKEDSERHSDDDTNFFSFAKFKPLQCPDCDMTFPCFSELVSHQDTHAEEKPHKCKTCEKSFTSESELACHQKSHRAEEPFKCTVCGKGFRVKMDLIAHKRIHMKHTK